MRRGRLRFGGRRHRRARRAVASVGVRGVPVRALGQLPRLCCPMMTSWYVMGRPCARSDSSSRACVGSSFVSCVGSGSPRTDPPRQRRSSSQVLRQTARGRTGCEWFRPCAERSPSLSGTYYFYTCPPSGRCHVHSGPPVGGGECHLSPWATSARTGVLLGGRSRARVTMKITFACHCCSRSRSPWATSVAARARGRTRRRRPRAARAPRAPGRTGRRSGRLLTSSLRTRWFGPRERSFRSAAAVDGDFLT